MESYKNLSGNSEVKSYRINNDSIIVEFKDGNCYLYNYESAGRRNIEIMKGLAISGLGLNGFIDRHVRHSYAKKIR